MGQPLFLAENFFSVQQFPGHVISSVNPTAVGSEAFHAGTARRSVLNQVRNADPTLQLLVIAECDRLREADTLILDRNSDVIPRSVALHVSSDNFTTFETILSAFVEPDVVLGASLNDQTHWIVTDENVVMMKFPRTAAFYWRVAVDALDGDSGALGGVYLGKSFSPTYGGRLPFDDEDTWLDFGEVRRGVPDNDVRFGRTGAFGMMMSGEAEWNEARRQFRDLFGKGYPMWIAPDSDLAERTWLGYNAPGSMAATFSERPQGRTIVVRADEYDGVLP